MIITKTPVRISLFSGGSDLPAFFQKEDGAALSVTIDKYIYVMTHVSQNPGIRLKFDEVEHAEDLDKIKHIITRETLRHVYGGAHFNGWEIASTSDVSYNGCGLGTSSAFTVGFLNSLLKTSVLGPGYLANEACKIEIDCCGLPVGKQDQFAAAYGGMNLFKFLKNGTVEVREIEHHDELEEKLVMFYTGISRDGNTILTGQAASMEDPIKFARVRQNRDKAFEAIQYLFHKDYDMIGELFAASWAEKKQILNGITLPVLDAIYDIAMKNGALGGKLLGAGGGGFFIFYAPNFETKQRLIRALNGLYPGVRHFPFKFSYEGSKVVYNDREA